MPGMIDQPYKSVIYEWLTEAGERIDGSAENSFGETGWIDYPMPPEIGEGGYEVLELALGMSLVRSSFNFSTASMGKVIPLMNVDVTYNEPSFQAMVLRGLRGSVKENYPASISLGTRHNTVQVLPWTDPSVASFVISRSGEAPWTNSSATSREKHSCWALIFPGHLPLVQQQFHCTYRNIF